MFSLIITIISIALVAALALATIYYGGSAFNKSSASANASKFLNQSQQILGADRLYRVDHEGQMPPNMQALIDGGYLKSIPTAQIADKFEAVAAPAAEWSMIATATGRAYQYTSTAVDPESCKAVNYMSLRQDGILSKVFSGFKTQCYESGANTYNIVVLADSTVFPTGLAASALPGTPEYVEGSSITNTDWAVAPSTSNGSGSGGGSGGGSGTPSTPVTRVQMTLGLSAPNWEAHMYEDANFTVKSDYNFESGLRGAYLMNAIGQCGFIVGYDPDSWVFTAEPYSGTVARASCYIHEAAPGNYTLKVESGDYREFYVPVTVVSGSN